jgi:DNA-binding protein H-NS
MKHAYLKSMSVDELWLLREKITASLATKLAAEKKMVERRLSLLKNALVEQKIKASKRRPYPPVVPKFRNPDKQSETWAGRGKQPRWLRKQLRSGKRVDDFRIESEVA